MVLLYACVTLNKFSVDVLLLLLTLTYMTYLREVVYSSYGVGILNLVCRRAAVRVGLCPGIVFTLSLCVREILLGLVLYLFPLILFC